MTTFGIISLILSVIMAGAGMYAQHQANQQNIEQNNLNREDTQEFNAEEAEKAREANIEQYNLLYSPEAKVKQYKDAGLSPALMYSGGGAASAGGSTQMASTGMAGTPLINPIIPQSGILDLFQQEAETAKTKSETERNKEEIKNRESERAEIQSKIEVNNATINEITSQTNLNNVRTQNEALDGMLKQFELDYASATQKNRIKIVEETLSKIKNENEKILTDIENAKIDKDNKQKLYDAQLQKYKAETAKLIKEKLLVEAETYLNEAKKIYEREQTKLSIAERQKKWTEIMKLESDITLNTAQVQKLLSDVDLNNAKEVSEVMNQIMGTINAAAKIRTPKE